MSRCPHSFWFLFLTCVVSFALPTAARGQVHPSIQFLDQHCLDCHTGSDAEGGLDLSTMPKTLDEDSIDTWVRIYDRVQDGEMPPPDASTLTEKERQSFGKLTETWLTEFQSAQFEKLGRVRSRRLTHLQLERTLHDLLKIDVPLVNEMPEEPRTHGFTGIAETQSMSHFQLENHLRVVDLALDAAFHRFLGNPDWAKRDLNARAIARRNPRRRCREPEMLDGDAVVWNSNMPFYGRVPGTTAEESGWYRFQLTAKALKPPKTATVWCSIKSGACISNAPLLTWQDGIELGPDPRTVTFDAWIPEGHMLEIRPADSTLKLARFRNGQVGAGEGGPQNVPGIAMSSISMRRIFPHAKETAQQAIFGDLEIVKLRKSKTSKLGYQKTIQTQSPKQDLDKLVTQFATRAFRRPVSSEALAPYLRLAKQEFQISKDFVSALRSGYRAILCSPRFMYFTEPLGELDNFAIANRLSYFLWNRMPDKTLFDLAKSGKLGQPDVLQQQVDRMLDHEYGEAFVKDLADQWLDMSQINFTEPDKRMFRDFDAIVQNSMLAETHHFLNHMLKKNLSIRLLIDSNYTFVNSRLADYYELANRSKIQGDAMQKIQLEPEDHRGGLMTQGAVLKVTANGTATSPVVRGVWMAEKLLGETIPLPPSNVPAIEPDIRGATTIRELLAKHKSIETCASCHRKIDPPGFALESYDPAGKFRTKYIVRKQKKDKAKKVETHGELSDGTPFRDTKSFQRLLQKRPKQLAHNVAEKLLTYATGATIEFADRPAIDRCVEQAASQDYGFRSLVKAVVVSEPFLSK